MMAKSLQDSFENLEKTLTDRIRTCHPPNLTSSSGFFGSQSDPEQKQPPPKRPTKQEVSGDDVIHQINKQQIHLPPIRRNRQC